MAGTDNIIEIVIKAVDEMSIELKQMQSQLNQFNTSSGNVDKTMQKMTTSGSHLFRSLTPLRILLSQLAGVGGGLSIALANLVRFGFNPVTLAISGIVAGVGLFVTSIISAKRETEAFNKAMDAQFKTVTELNLQYQVMIGRVDEVTASVLRFRRSQAETLQTLFAALESAKSTGKLTPDFIKGWTALLGLNLPGGEKDIKERIEDVSAFIRGIDASAKAMEKIGKEKPGVDFTKSLKDQILQLQIQRKELIEGAEAAFEFALAQKAIAAGLDPESFRKQIDAIMELREEIKSTTEAQKELAEAVAKELKRLEAIPDVQRRITEVVIDGVEARKEGLEREIFMIARWEAAQLEALEKLKKEYPELAKKINEAMDSINKQAAQKVDEAVKKENDRIEQQAETLAKNFVDRFIALLEGEKLNVKTALANFGRTVVSDMLQEMMKELIKQSGLAGKNMSIGAMLAKIIMGQPISGGGGTGGFLGSIGSFLGGIGNFFFGAQGGMIVPHGAVRAFAGGGTVHGPTMGILGEEGPEIVARMKPARPGDGMEGKVTVIIQGDIVPRDPSMKAKDVILVLADDMQRGGKSAKAVEAVIRRGG